MSTIKKSEGFTLIEMMVVIVIIGILAAIAIPKFMEASVKAKVSEIPVVLASYEHSELAYIAEKAQLSTGLSQLVFDSSTAGNSKWFSYVYVSGGAAGNTYTGTTKTALGNFLAANKSLITTVALSGTIGHTSGSSADSLIFAKFVPNFFK